MIVSRVIVPHDLCDVSVNVASSLVVDAKVTLLHPLRNYAIIQYDPSLVSAPIRSAKLATNTILQGSWTTFLGFTVNGEVMVAETTVTHIATVTIPSDTDAPHYPALNLDAVRVDTDLSYQCDSGVLVAKDGTIEALWMLYEGPYLSRHGVATPTLLPVISQVRNGIIPDLHILNVEIETVEISQVRIMGVSEKWIEQVRHQLFMIRKIACADAGVCESESLLEGDIILTLDGELITRVSELDIKNNNGTLDALIFRNGQEMRLTVPTIPTKKLQITQAILSVVPFSRAHIMPYYNRYRSYILGSTSRLAQMARRQISISLDPQTLSRL